MRFHITYTLPAILYCLNFGSIARAQDGTTFLNPPQNLSPTMQQWDQIIAGIEDIRELRSAENGAKLDALFTAMRAYFGAERLSRQAFDIIMQQHFQLADKVPGYGKKVLEERSVEAPFTIEYTNRLEEAFHMNREKWTALYNAWVTEHQAAAAPILELSPEEQVRFTTETVERLARENKEFQIALNAPERQAELAVAIPNKQERSLHIQQLRREFQETLMNDPGMRAIISFGIYRRLQEEDLLGESLRALDAPKVRAGLVELQHGFLDIFKLEHFSGLADRSTDPPAGGAEDKVIVPAILRNAAKRFTPNAQKALSNQELFATAEIKGLQRQTFYQVHRPLYGTFRGAYNNECQGGGCTFATSALERRHAVAVLDGVQIQYGEALEGESSRLRGFTEVVPVSLNGDARVFGSLIVGNPSFANEVYRNVPETGEQTKTTIFDLWFEATPKVGEGLTISETTSADNAHAIEKVRRSLSYLVGTPLGAANDFVLSAENQAFAQRIVAASTGRSEFGYAAPNVMIFDATTRDANRITMLRQINDRNLNVEFSRLTPEELIHFLGLMRKLELNFRQKYAKAVSRLLDHKDPEVRLHAAAWAMDLGRRDEKVVQIITGELLRSGHSLDSLNAAVEKIESLDISMSAVHPTKIMQELYNSLQPGRDRRTVAVWLYIRRAGEAVLERGVYDRNQIFDVAQAITRGEVPQKYLKAIAVNSNRQIQAARRASSSSMVAFQGVLRSMTRFIADLDSETRALVYSQGRPNDDDLKRALEAANPLSFSDDEKLVWYASECERLKCRRRSGLEARLAATSPELDPLHFYLRFRTEASVPDYVLSSRLENWRAERELMYALRIIANRKEAPSPLMRDRLLAIIRNNDLKREFRAVASYVAYLHNLYTPEMVPVLEWVSASSREAGLPRGLDSYGSASFDISEIRMLRKSEGAWLTFIAKGLSDHLAMIERDIRTEGTSTIVDYQKAFAGYDWDELFKVSPEIATGIGGFFSPEVVGKVADGRLRYFASLIDPGSSLATSIVEDKFDDLIRILEGEDIVAKNSALEMLGAGLRIPGLSEERQARLAQVMLSEIERFWEARIAGGAEASAVAEDKINIAYNILSESVATSRLHFTQRFRSRIDQILVYGPPVTDASMLYRRNRSPSTHLDGVGYERLLDSRLTGWYAIENTDPIILGLLNRVALDNRLAEVVANIYFSRLATRITNQVSPLSSSGARGREPTQAERIVLDNRFASLVRQRARQVGQIQPPVPPSQVRPKIKDVCADMFLSILVRNRVN